MRRRQRHIWCRGTVATKVKIKIKFRCSVSGCPVPYFDFQKLSKIKFGRSQSRYRTSIHKTDSSRDAGTVTILCEITAP